jgi:multidrug efflux pump subunit AcrB
MPNPDSKFVKKTIVRKRLQFSELNNSVPLSQISNGIDIQWKNPEVRRIDGERAMKAQACPRFGHNAQELLDRVRPQIDKIKLPEGYVLSWRGEYEASNESKSYLALNVPLACILILFILILLFKDYKKPIIILLSLPTVTIGIVFGVILTGKEFGFTCIVGALGLMGMMIKNGVVLIDEIVFQIQSGVDEYKAVVDSAVSRIRPVSMASLTTILGMLPLVSDDMFGAMAVTIMSGLLIGTITVIILIPVLYSIFFGVKK